MVTAEDAKALAAMGRAIQEDANGLGLGEPPSAIATVPPWPWVERYDATVTNSELRKVTRGLFVDGHYARSVEEAYKCLNNSVKSKSGLPAADGNSLMRTAFSPTKPVLRLNGLRSISQRDEQRGYMDIYAGAMSGVRNPRAHEHELEDHPEVALELLTLANHLMRKLDSTKKSRKRK